MKIKRWKRIAFAACLTAFTAFACKAVACPHSGGVRAQQTSRSEAVIRGEGLIRVGGYGLNVRFTPEGKLVGFDISAVPLKKTPSDAGTQSKLERPAEIN